MLPAGQPCAAGQSALWDARARILHRVVVQAFAARHRPLHRPQIAAHARMVGLPLERIALNDYYIPERHCRCKFHVI
jgi:hypothetical protein